MRTGRREQLFPQLINEMALKNNESIFGVEVGVAEGKHAMNLLKNSNLTHLTCIDPYPNDIIWSLEKDGDKCYQKALNNLEPWIKEGRCKVLRSTGLEEVNGFDDNSIHFVYLDGDRTPAVYKEEMIKWLSKLKIGGILSGHDYKNKRGFTVKDMVDTFTAKNDYELMLSGGACRSWYFVKTKCLGST